MPPKGILMVPLAGRTLDHCVAVRGPEGRLLPPGDASEQHAVNPAAITGPATANKRFVGEREPPSTARPSVTGRNKLPSVIGDRMPGSFDSRLSAPERHPASMAEDGR
jgi:hypothetical protein